MATEAEPVNAGERDNAGETSADKSWTETTTDTLGKVVHAAHDMIANAGEALHKAASEPSSVSSTVYENVAAAAETVAEYARDAKEHVVEAASTAADRIASLGGSGESDTGNGNGNGDSANSPTLEPSSKRPKIQVQQAGGPGLEANVDESLKGPQTALRTSTKSPPPVAIKGQTARLLRANVPAHHKRADSSDKYWKPNTYE